MIYTVEYKGERKTISMKAKTSKLDLAVKAFGISDVEPNEVRILASSPGHDIVHNAAQRIEGY